MVIKQCSDDEYGSLGVEYEKYKDHFKLLKDAESMSKDYKVKLNGQRLNQRVLELIKDAMDHLFYYKCLDLA